MARSAAIPGDGRRIVRRRALVVRLHAVEAAEQEQRARDLELAQAPARAAVEVAAEGGQGGVAVAHLALHPSAGEQHLRVLRRGGRPSGGARRAPRRA